MHIWHSRGYLPHFEGGEIAQSITYRLYDSFPNGLLLQWQRELKLLPEKEANSDMRKRIEAYLDKGHGQAFLKDPIIARVIQESFLKFDGKRYKLCAWIIMPNHIHILIIPNTDFKVSTIIQTWKSYTAKKANAILNRQGKFWQEDYFDRYIRKDEHYRATIDYIENNPVKAALCKHKEDWPFGSAYGGKVANSNDRTYKELDLNC